MKKAIIITSAIVALAATQAGAKIWRVNNQGYQADFAQINQAVADPNVLAGDTLHVEGSTVEYNSATITKPLIIIGPGYNLSQNPKTSTNNLEAIVGPITINNTAPGTHIIGISAADGWSYGVTINANDVVIKRCKFINRIDISPSLTNIAITQNFFYNVTSGNTSSAISFNWSYGFPGNLRFNNNIVQRPLAVSDNSSFTFLECNNNVFDLAIVPSSGHSLQFYAASFRNNILVNNNASVKINGITNFSTTPNAAVSHNIGTSSIVHFGTANNNLVLTNISTIWNTATTASRDGKYRLANNSAASGSGYGGVDRGAYGGAAVSNRYTPSGLAPVPVIYEVSTSGVATPGTGLNITIKARTVE